MASRSHAYHRFNKKVPIQAQDPDHSLQYIRAADEHAQLDAGVHRLKNEIALRSAPGKIFDIDGAVRFLNQEGNSKSA